MDKKKFIEDSSKIDQSGIPIPGAMSDEDIKRWKSQTEMERITEELNELYVLVGKAALKEEQEDAITKVGIRIEVIKARIKYLKNESESDQKTG